MLTVLLLLGIILVAAFAFAVFAGLMAFSLPLLILVGLVLIDVMVMKLIFGRKRKKKEE